MAGTNVIIVLIASSSLFVNTSALLLTNQDGSYFKKISGYRLTNTPSLSMENPGKKTSFCTQKCQSEATCKTVTVNQDKTLCKFYDKSVLLGRAAFALDASWDTYTKNEEGWHMVFKVTAGISQVVGPLWTGSTSDANPPGASILNVMDNCNCHYKHKMVENWNALKPKQIKLSIYETISATEKMSLVFDGANTDKLTWFSVGKIDYSQTNAWTDLQSYPINLGIDNTFPRCFYISSEHLGCALDTGWLSVTDQATGGCTWDNYGPASWPRILYSGTGYRIQWENDPGAVLSADRLAIFVRL